jgi:hypothetical protein
MTSRATPDVVFIRDDGSVFDAPIDDVWRFLGSGAPHSDAPHHRNVRRRRLGRNSGTYSWEQDFLGEPVRFAMRWVAFAPLGLAYEVLEGPFAGSDFFLYYTPDGPRTAVTVVGHFNSKTIPVERLERAVNRFFSDEFDQDRAALREQTPEP